MPTDHVEEESIQPSAVRHEAGASGGLETSRGAADLKRVLLHLTVIVALAAGLFFFRLGAADWRGDVDTQVGQIIEDMVDGKGWVLPLRNGIHVPDKPPLLTWLGSLSAIVRGSGVDILDARLPSAVVATLGVIGVYAFASSLAGTSVGLWAAIILTTTEQFVVSARDSRVDMVFTVCLTFSLFLIWRVYNGEGGRTTARLAGLFCGLAILSKGPLALVLGVLLFGSLVFVAPPLAGWRLLLDFPTLFLALGVPAVWYVAATLQEGMAFVRVLLLAENVNRLTGGLGKWPVWYYVMPLFALGLPWTLALPSAALGASALPERAKRFLWVWVAVMFVFLSAALGKRQVYILPLRPALAILLAGWLVPWMESWEGRQRDGSPPGALLWAGRALILVVLAVVLVLMTGIGGIGADAQEWPHWWQLHLRQTPFTTLLTILGLGVGIEWTLRYGWQRRLPQAVAALVGVLALGTGFVISADAIVRGEAVSFRSIAEQVARQVPPGEPLAFLGLDDEYAVTFLFHLRRHVPPVALAEGRGSCTPPRPGAFLLAEEQWNEWKCADDGRWHLLARGGPALASHGKQRLVLARYGETP